MDLDFCEEPSVSGIVCGVEAKMQLSNNLRIMSYPVYHQLN